MKSQESCQQVVTHHKVSVKFEETLDTDLPQGSRDTYSSCFKRQDICVSTSRNPPDPEGFGSSGGLSAFYRNANPRHSYHGPVGVKPFVDSDSDSECSVPENKTRSPSLDRKLGGWDCDVELERSVSSSSLAVLPVRGEDNKWKVVLDSRRAQRKQVVMQAGQPQPLVHSTNHSPWLTLPITALGSLYQS